MGLVAVEKREALALPGFEISRAFSLLQNEKNARKWLEHTASEITHHDGECCSQARSWLLGMAQSMENASLCDGGIRAPHWLSDRFEWGPSRWPIAWCELIEQDVIDCGVFAALVREIFHEQGVRAHPGQVVIQYSETCTHHWQQLWRNGAALLPDAGSTQPGEFFPWVGKNLVYHEICVVEAQDGIARLYDSTWGNWYQPHLRDGFGAVVAVRTQCAGDLLWGDRVLRSGEWMVMA